jgi:hypothetical protein
MPWSDDYLNKWGRQWLGAFGGAVLGWGISVLFPVLARRFTVLTIVLWSAAIGAALMSLDNFARAGAALTHSQNRLFNLLVGVGFPALILLIVMLLLR